jgi:hypothetical protein
MIRSRCVLGVAALLLPVLANAADVRAPEEDPRAVDPTDMPSSAGLIPPGARRVSADGADLVSLTLVGRPTRAALTGLSADLRSVHYLPSEGDSLYAVRVPRENLEALLGLDGLDRVQFSTTVATTSRFSR